MAQMMDLPVELLESILSRVLEGSRHISSLALVNRLWRTLVTTVAYRSWTYNGARNSFRYLFLFLQTILINRDLACTVQRVHIGNWGVNAPALLNQKLDYHFDKHDLDRLDRALGQAGLRQPNTIQEIQQGDCRPLVALLLASLPNLVKIHAHVPSSDQYLATLLKLALERERSSPLNQLRELYVFAEITVVPGQDMEVGDHPDTPVALLRPHNLWPVFFLRSLRTLHMYDLVTDGLGALIRDNRKNRDCYITNLAVRCGDSRYEPVDVQTLITLPVALSNLSLFIDNRPSLVFKTRPPRIWNSLHIWDSLEKHQATLRYLDIFRAGYQEKNLVHFGSLKCFTQLKRLYIQFQILTGIEYDDTPDYTAHLHLQDTLPGTLESLYLYDVGHVHSSILETAKQATDLVTAGTHPHLRSITGDDRHFVQAVLDQVPQPHATVAYSHQDLNCWQAIRPQCPIPRGGSCLDFWRDMIHMRNDGQRRYIQLMSALFPEDQDDTGPVLPYGYKTHVIPITDHTAAGSTSSSTSTCTRPQPRAYMVFKNYTCIPLTPLFSIVIYFTHPNPNPDPSSLPTQLPSLLSALTDNDDDFEPRLDVYLLPGASASDCVAHYTEEQAAHGTSAAQVRAFKRYLAASSARAPIGLGLGLVPPPPTPAQGRLPGMMTSYPEVNAQGLLFICHGRDWRDPDGRMTLECVDFVSQDLLDSDDDDDEDQDRDNDGPDDLNPNSNPSTTAPAGGREEKEKGGQNSPRAAPMPDDPIRERTVWPINKSSPAVDEAYCDWPMDKWMGESFYYVDNELKHAWQKASSLGWTHWI